VTQPPIDPAARQPFADASPTEPVPLVTPPAMDPPPGAPAFAASEGLAPSPVFAAPEPAGPGSGTPAPAFTFSPVEPEPAPGLPPAPGAAARATAPARGGGSSRVINIALGAAILVGAAGIAFAAGRATSPASSTASVPAAASGPQGGVNRGNGNSNGNGGLNGGNLPDASFDLNGNGNGGPGDRPGDLDGGLGFDRGRGFGGFGLSGTVTAVTSDSITIQTDAGPVITFGLDGTTTYHQQTDASASDVKTGTKVQVSPNGRIQPTQGANGEIDLGTAGSITIVP
jgi:hypothetical protein